MSSIAFHQLPRAIHLTTALAWALGWVCFAEFVIDRLGWDHWLPGYRYGRLCLWDVAIFAGILLITGWAARRPRTPQPASARAGDR
jgi:glucose dehydrogenase